jgi:hypothetical protein
MSMVLSLLVTPDLVDDIRALRALDGVKVGDPQSWESMSDAADAPMGAQEIQLGLQVFTAAFQTAAAALTFLVALRNIKKKRDDGDVIKVVSPKTGKKLLDIDQKTSDDVMNTFISDISDQ